MLGLIVFIFNFTIYESVIKRRKTTCISFHRKWAKMDSWKWWLTFHNPLNNTVNTEYSEQTCPENKNNSVTWNFTINIWSVLNKDRDMNADEALLLAQIAHGDFFSLSHFRKFLQRNALQITLKGCEMKFWFSLNLTV